jgi:hypothetical protein
LGRLPESNLGHRVGVGISVLLGALVYYVADRIVDGPAVDGVRTGR